MYTLEEFYVNAWCWKIGKKESEFKKLEYTDLNELFKTQWSDIFIKYMRNRMVMGYFRYGNTGYPYIAYLKYKLSIHEKTGNLEMLVDVANLAVLEFINGEHPKKYWPDTFDSNAHCEKE